MEKQELTKTIGKTIRTIRKKHNISQVELGLRCLKDKQSIEKIENGKVNPTIYTLYLIAKALNVELSELVEEVK
jgi:putative transcriptional regulator